MSLINEVELKFVSDYGTEKIDAELLNSSNYISTDNLIAEKGGAVNSDYLPIKGRVSKYSVGDSLVSNIRPYFKKILFAKVSGGCSNDVIVFKPKLSKIDPKYLYYQLSKDEFFDFMMAGANGTKMPRGNKNSIPLFKILLPPLPTQGRIASILSAYDDLIENNIRRIKLLEETAKRTYEEWFVKFRVNGEQLTASDFETMSLSKMIKEYMNGGWGKETNEGNYHVASYVIRGTDFPNLNSGSFNNIPLRFHTSSNFKPRQLITGDISIEMSNGNINNIGRTFFNDGSLEQILKIPIICASFCKLLRPINLEFGYLIDLHLKHIQQTGAMKVYKSQAANGINNFQFEELIEKESLIIPKGEYLKKFVDSISYTYNLGAILKNQIYKLKESRDILLPKLMNGNINIE